MVLRSAVSDICVTACRLNVADAYHGFGGIDDPVPGDGIDFHRHIVSGDRILLFDLGGYDALIDQHLAFDQRNEEYKPGPRVPTSLPRRKTTPRSYSFAMRIHPATTTIITIIATTAIMTGPNAAQPRVS